MSVELLQRFCAGPASRRAMIQTPFSQVYEGQAWGIGSDGTRMLMLADVDTGRMDDGPNVANALAPFRGSSREYSIDLATLAAFVGMPTAPEPCTRCDGGMVICQECHGKRWVDCQCTCGHEHEKECEYCADSVDGRVLCACQKWRGRHLRKVMIGDALFDAGLVAASLADAERCDGTATWVATTPDGPHMLRGDGWRIVMMPLRIDTPELIGAYPRFALPEPILTQVGRAE